MVAVKYFMEMMISSRFMNSGKCGLEVLVCYVNCSNIMYIECYEQVIFPSNTRQ